MNAPGGPEDVEEQFPGWHAWNVSLPDGTVNWYARPFPLVFHITGPSDLARSARGVGLGGAQDSQDVGADQGLKVGLGPAPEEQLAE